MVVVLVEIHDIADWLLQRNQSWWRIFVMIRKMQNIDIDRVADIWLKTNLKAHYFIPEQYWTSNDIVNIGLHFILKNVRPYAAPCSEA